MTKNEFLSILNAELINNSIVDVADIVNEYEQHFDFKLADGYSEEEIAAKLGDPAALAAEYEQADGVKPGRGRRITTIIGLSIADMFAGIFFIFLAAWGIVMGA